MFDRTHFFSFDSDTLFDFFISARTMHTKIEIEQLCAEHDSMLISIDSEPKKSYKRDTEVAIQCCVLGCNETVSKTLRNLFLNQNFGCKVHSKQLKAKKIKKTKGTLNLQYAANQDSGERYSYEELCNMECRPSLFDICQKLKISQYHNLNKNAVIHAILEQQENLDLLKGVEETKNKEVLTETDVSTEMIVCEEETKNEEMLMETKVVEPIELTQDLKSQFLDNHHFFQYDKRVWTQANLIAQYLQYKTPAKAISDIVEVDDKLMFHEFPEKIQVCIKQQDPKCNHSLQQSTIFITTTGILELFMRSQLPLARKMKRWLINDVIPSILSTGAYSLNASAAVAQSTIQTLAIAEACPRKTTCHNPKGYPISSMKSAIYILHLPQLNLFKFGFSNNLIDRFKQHEYNFREISIELIVEAPDVQEIETRLKTDIRSHGINTVFKINGRTLKELFEPEHLKRVSKIIQNILNNYKTNAECTVLCEQMKIEKEKTRQQEIVLRQQKCILRQKEMDVEILNLRIKLFELEGKRKFDETL